MNKMSFRRIALNVIALSGLALCQIATMDVALAKSAHCSSTPVPGQPGHYIVICSRVRP